MTVDVAARAPGYRVKVQTPVPAPLGIRSLGDQRRVVWPALLALILLGVGVIASVRWIMNYLLRHVLLADIGMPEQDGYALIEAVRALPTSEAIVPAVAVTAYVSSRDRARAFKAGYGWHVAKPVEPDQLVAVVTAASQSHPSSQPSHPHHRQDRKPQHAAHPHKQTRTQQQAHPTPPRAQQGQRPQQGNRTQHAHKAASRPLHGGWSRPNKPASRRTWWWTMTAGGVAGRWRWRMRRKRRRPAARPSRARRRGGSHRAPRGWWKRFRTRTGGRSSSSSWEA
jgi:CheY-like chemotaxis protein